MAELKSESTNATHTYVEIDAVMRGDQSIAGNTRSSEAQEATANVQPEKPEPRIESA